MNRRDSIKLLAVAALTAVVPGCTPADVERAADRVKTGTSVDLDDRNATVLDAHNFETVHTLVDFIIPKDEHSGSASDAGVPMFIDFLLEDVPDMKVPVLDGLKWLDSQCLDEFDLTFIDCDEMQQHSLLDRIAYPNQVDDDLQDGAAFFTTMRNLTASGFFSSKMGMEDVQYIGNVMRPEWTGCPDDAMAHVGSAYDS